MFQSVFVIVVALKTLADGLSIFNQGTILEKINVEKIFIFKMNQDRWMRYQIMSKRVLLIGVIHF